METTNPSSSARILTRTPPPPSSSSSATPPLPPPSSSSWSSYSFTTLGAPPDLPSIPSPSPSLLPHPLSSLSHHRPPVGVVVVGFIGRRPDDVTPLINRVLDSNVFGSGNLEKRFCIEDEEFRCWFLNRRISYYHEEERGILYLQYCLRRCPAMGRVSDSHPNFDAVLEERDFGDLQGLLFMFSVCHVVVYVQEGSRFDTQILKKFRVLQAAKHALTSFAKSRITPPLATRSPSSSSQPSGSVTNSNPSLGRSGGILNRNASSISLMSGLGSYTTLLPGRCTPVTLFAFLDDFSDTLDNIENTTDTSAINQSSTSSSFTRPSLPTKGSTPVVVLARPVNRSEVSFRKKLQSSLEAQIRFLIKKCRTITGSESNHSGSRNTGGSSSAPLFSLDASRCIVLLERRSNENGESLEFATGLVQDVLKGKSSSDYFLHESHGQSANREDIHSIREFIYRQSDILRGRGGLVANSNSGSAAGVGMVAAAAAAAAASAASKKTFTIPELPSLEIWLSSSQTVLQGLLSSKRGGIEEAEMGKRKSRQRNTDAPQIEAIASRVTEPLEVAVSLLESGKGLNMRFSTSWCQRSLPTAKEVYLKELPACYPTSQHEAHLEKALRVFCSMVKGPAVQLFMKKLEDECISIWTSGRQQCDAVSLTGNPCVHQRHSVEGDSSPSGAAVKPHSSGFVFLLACACGRSRKLRPDPFDFESANITSSHFPDCDKLLPAVQLPKVSFAGPIQTSSWSLIRVGGARYYESSTGLLQSGFCAAQKFLLKWTIFLEKWKNQPVSSDSTGHVSANRLDSGPKFGVLGNEGMKPAAPQLFRGEVQSGVENQIKPLVNIKSDNKKISFGRGFPHFTMMKPFSEVVAGSAAADSGFPPLHPRKQPSFDSEKVLKQTKARDRSEGRVHATANNQGSQSSGNVASVQENSNGINANVNIGAEPFLQIGSNVVPVHVNGDGKIKLDTSLKRVTVYIGFEHECPHGHRFLLTPEHLNDLGSLYSLPEDAHMPSSIENSNCKPADPIKLRRNSGHVKVHRHSNGKNIAAVSRVRNSEKSKEIFGNGFHRLEGVMQSSAIRKEQDQAYVGVSSLPDSENNVEEQLQSFSLNDGGYAFSLLNRNVPIYMNCPHCRISKAKKDSIKIKFANAISQLQRIFMVTPPFPFVLATCPAIQFEAPCLPSFIPDRDQLLEFSIGCQVILPPESFLALRLPFVYGVQLADQSLHPLKPLQHQPELTAWINKGTTLQVLSREAVLMGDSEYC